MIAFNTNQKIIVPVNKSPRKDQGNFDALIKQTPKTITINPVEDAQVDAAGKNSRQKLVSQPAFSLTNLANETPREPQYYKLNLTSSADYAINQYKQFASFEKNAPKETLLGINIFA